MGKRDQREKPVPDDGRLDPRWLFVIGSGVAGYTVAAAAADPGMGLIAGAAVSTLLHRVLFRA